jgi:glycosyltransferase involved in cell wall biosynthesis
MGTPEFDRCALELGYKAERIQGRGNPMGYHPLQAHILERAADLRPDLVFIQSHETPVVSPETLDALRDQGAFVVFWVGDVRDPIPSYYDAVAPRVDVIAFTNIPDVLEMRARGHRSEYLQIGYDETIYDPGAERSSKRPRRGVVFMGNNYKGRFPQSDSRAAMVNRLRREFGSDFTLFGKGWGGQAWATTPTDEVKAYRSAIVAVNWDHFHRPYFASDRILRAQACGCAVVSQDYEGLSEEHPYVGGASDLDEMVKMVREALEHPEIARQSGERCAQNVRERHTWHQRIKTLEQWVTNQ